MAVTCSPALDRHAALKRIASLNRILSADFPRGYPTLVCKNRVLSSNSRTFFGFLPHAAKTFSTTFHRTVHNQPSCPPLPSIPFTAQDKFQLFLHKMSHPTKHPHLPSPPPPTTPPSTTFQLHFCPLPPTLALVNVGQRSVALTPVPWCDHTWATTPDPIRTPQLSAHGPE